MNSYLTARIFSFFVTKLRNSSPLRALCALNLKILARHLRRPDLIRGSLGKIRTVNTGNKNDKLDKSPGTGLEYRA